MVKDVSINKEISIGNLISWALILLGFAVGYTKLQGTAALALERANEAQATAISAHAQINSLKTDIAVIRVTVTNVEGKLDEIKLRIFAAPRTFTGD